MTTTAAESERITAVRAFSRLYTKVLGLLGEGLLATPHSLSEARVIFELAQGDQHEVVALRHELGLDAGNLSRVLARLEAAGLVERERSTTDARRQVVRLTASGRAAFVELDERSAAQVHQLLAPLDDGDQRRLVGAMDAIRALLEPGEPRPTVVLRAPEPGDLGWIVERHGALYAREHGWSSTFEALVARIAADYLDDDGSPGQHAWIAEVAGERAGCVLCVRRDDTTAQLRLLLVEPSARGLGIGGRLVEECVRFARRSGYRAIVLWTNDVLVAARRIYERAGFALVEQGAHRSFGHDLVEQTWRLEL